jgi:hypothetical protein
MQRAEICIVKVVCVITNLKEQVDGVIFFSFPFFVYANNDNLIKIELT